ncbi:hypothetical protein F0562_019904 [Nyssa sinensis]|uniref:Uncharacterized protein n=1 Tax=Nyssa sinensis TaxID=561372 RepID=A0A5J5BTT6_9ASTE|nr:hypothetical protein F0562_019904 [Nyssa sinensis]
MVGVDMVEEVEGGDEAVVIVGGEEAMAVGICNKSRVVTITMVDQGQHLLEAAGEGKDGAEAVGMGVVGISDQMVRSRQLPEL